MRARRVGLGGGILVVVLVLLWAVPRHVWRLRCREWTQLSAQHDGEGGIRIRPDYTDLTIPPNIAPLNFTVLSPGRWHYVEAKGQAGSPRVEVLSRAPDIRFPEGAWHRLLRANAGGQVTLLLCIVSADGTHAVSAPITLRVAREPIDPYLVCRVIPPLYNYWGAIEIRQRNLESFQERIVAHNRTAETACLNCHAFRANHADRMTVGIRSGKIGSSTVMVRDGEAEKIGTKFGYTAWHPSGLLAAYSANEVRQFFHSTAGEVRDVVDLDSGLAYYDLRTQTAKTTPGLNSDNRLETYPTWTPDGKWLYFCSAAFPWEALTRVPPKQYRDCRYDLCRISYDVATDTWGKPETVLPAARLGKSLLLPRISPDGRFLLFCACDYGCFPIYQPSSDLYLLDLKTGAHRRLDINSPLSESWHSWSSNGRWIAFSSKRRDGLLTRTYLSYVDASGKVHKPFIVPQKDPAFYDSFVKTYSVPELIVEPVPIRRQHLAAAITGPPAIKVDDPVRFGRKAVSDAAGEATWQSGRR